MGVFAFAVIPIKVVAHMDTFKDLPEAVQVDGSRILNNLVFGRVEDMKVPIPSRYLGQLIQR